MTAEILLTILLRVQLMASAAILMVLLLRPLVSRWCGARITYWLWLIVPIATIAGELPARSQIVLAAPIMTSTLSVPQHSIASSAASSALSSDGEFGPKRADLLIAVWLLGFGGLFGRSILRTRRLAASSSIGPALIGVLRPRLVLPADFATRFSAEERALILAHEEVHRVSRHVTVNAMVECLRCAGWFNPLMHLAALRFRADQELSCDAAVIAAHPSSRPTYAEALLKAQIASVPPPLGCMWTSASARRLGERITKLSEHAPGRRRRVAGMVGVLGLGIASGYAAWAQQPPQIISMPAPAPVVSTPVATPAAVNVVAAAAPVAAPTAAPAAAAGPAPATVARIGNRRIPMIDFRRSEIGSPTGWLIVSLSDPRTPINLRQQGNRILVDFTGAELPPEYQRNFDMTDFGTPVIGFNATNTASGAQLIIDAAGDFEQRAYLAGDRYIIEVQTRGVATAQVADKPVYTGERFSASFRDVPTRTLLQLLAHTGGKNIMLTDSVHGNTSLKVENVPWDQVLDMVLQIKGLDKRVQENLIIVGPAAELAEQDAVRERASRE